MRGIFCTRRKVFNSAVQKAKRNFWKAQQLTIDNIDTGDSKRFWKEIGKIGIVQDRNKSIPMEVVLPDSTVSTEKKDILQVWKDGFEGLLNPTETNNTSEEHIISSTDGTK